MNARATFLKMIDRLIPERFRIESDLPLTRATIVGVLIATPAVFGLALQQHLTHGSWWVTASVSLAAIGFAAAPVVLRFTSPQRMLDYMGAVIYFTTFVLGAVRGGPVLSVMIWNLILIYGSGFAHRRNNVVFVWGVLVIIQGVALHFWRLAAVVPYGPPTSGQELLSYLVAVVWSVVVIVLIERARKQLERERHVLAEQVDTLRRIEALGRLSGGIAHDFNNLLTVISSHAQMLAEDTDDPQMLDDIASIESAAFRGEEFTARLLAMSRGESEEPVLIDASDQVSDFFRLIRKMVPEHIHKEVDLQRGATAIIDKAALEQVLLNACMNASDAMEEGGTLRIEARKVVLSEPLLSVHGRVEPGTWVRVAVSDTGVGMAPEILQRMFDPFFSSKSRADSNGIGLSTAFAAVQRFDGHIIVESELGKGTTFAIYMPFVPGDTELATESSSRPRSGAIRILLVDDENAVRRATSRMLKRAGYEVEEAIDGAEALVVFRNDADGFDLVVTDVVMPNANGVQLADAIHKISSETPFVFLSGYADGPERAALAAKDSPFVSKPFKQHTLLKAIETAVKDDAIQSR